MSNEAKQQMKTKQNKIATSQAKKAPNQPTKNSKQMNKTNKNQPTTKTTILVLNSRPAALKLVCDEERGGRGGEGEGGKELHTLLKDCCGGQIN